MVIWKDILVKRVNVLFPFLNRVIVILTKSITNLRNIISCVETSTGFSGWIVNPSSRVSATVAIMLVKQTSKVSHCNSESSLYFTEKHFFDFRYLSERGKIFVKTLTAGENLLARTIYWQYSSFQNNFRYF